MAIQKVSGLTATTYLYTAVVVAWLAVPTAVSYQLQYKERGSRSWTNGPLVKPPTTSVTLTGLKTGMTYDFQVFANGV